MPQDTPSLDPLVALTRCYMDEGNRLRVTLIHAFSGCTSHINSFHAILKQLQISDVDWLHSMIELLQTDTRLMLARLDELMMGAIKSGLAEPKAPDVVPLPEVGVAEQKADHPWNALPSIPSERG